jgi:uncharacterized protein YeaO (DUF488 family)
MAFQIKRIYEPAKTADGARILVDRLWPRGVKKSTARLTLWMKDIAPSPGLRVWFDHRPERFGQFRRRYERELANNPAIAELRKLGRGKPVTLLCAAHDPKINHAVVLQSVLRARRSSLRSRTAKKTVRP